MIWVLDLHFKDEFIDAFQVWVSKLENESNYIMKTFYTNGRREFISIKLIIFCKKRGIIFKYAALYTNEENGFAERKWQTIVTMKDLLLLDSKLPLYFWAEIMDIANYLQNKLFIKS